jgi:hypothetical protein
MTQPLNALTYPRSLNVRERIRVVALKNHARKRNASQNRRNDANLHVMIQSTQVSPLKNHLVRRKTRKRAVVLTRNAPIVAVHQLNLRKRFVRSEVPEPAQVFPDHPKERLKGKREGSLGFHLTVVKTKAKVLVIAKKDAEEIWLI